MTKYVVQVHADFAVRFHSLGPGADGSHRVFDSTCDAASKTAHIVESTSAFAHLDASEPLFIREHFGAGGYVLMGHVTLPPSVEHHDWLRDFAQRLIDAACGHKGRCPDDRNRTVFWKAADLMATVGPLNLTHDFALFVDAPATPHRFNC